MKTNFNRSEASNTLISIVTMGCSEQLIVRLEGMSFFVILPFLLLLPRLLIGERVHIPTQCIINVRASTLGSRVAVTAELLLQTL